MKKSTVRLLLLSILLIFWVGSTLATTVYMHEKAHQTIFNSYGIASKVNYGILLWTTEPINASDWAKCNENCQSLQLMNEVVGYPLQILITLASIIAFVCILYLVDWREK